MKTDDLFRGSINLKHLYYFYVIAQEGSIKKSATRLGLTQAALSSQLSQLEKWLKVRLFDRRVRKLILNSEGKIALDYASKIFRLTEDLVNTLTNPSVVPRKTIRIGTLPTLSKDHIHEFVLPLWKDQNVNVAVKEDSLLQLMNSLNEGQFDLILIDRPTIPIGTQLRAFRLEPRKIVVVGHPRFKSFRKNFPISLQNQPFLFVTRNSQIRSDIDHYMRSQRVVPQLVGEADDAALLRVAAENGVGLTALPRNTVNSSLKRGSLVQIGEMKEIRSDMWAICQSSSEHYARLKSIIDRFIEKQGS